MSHDLARSKIRLLINSESPVHSCRVLLCLIFFGRNKFEDFNFNFDKVPIYYDNSNTISLSKNHVLHSRAKNIEVSHHFFGEDIQKEDITVEFVRKHDQLAEIFTKPFHEERLRIVRRQLGIGQFNESLSLWMCAYL